MIKGKIGCEIECFSLLSDYPKLVRLCRRIGYEVSSDGTINYDYENEKPHELKSKVYNLSDIKHLFKDVEKIFKLVKVNKSCGLHIHISFENMLNYCKLLNWDFIKLFQEKYETNFSLTAEKERKTNHYSKFYQDKRSFLVRTKYQLNDRGKSSYRYQSINFNSYNLYKTVEFRIFAATNSITRFKKNVNFLLETIENFLTEKSFNEINVKRKLYDPKGNEKVEIVQYIRKKEIETLGENNNV